MARLIKLALACVQLGVAVGISANVHAQDNATGPPAASPTDAEPVAADGVVESIPLAEAEPAPLPEASNRRVSIDEIVVTAQKREQNLQDVPITVSAFSGDELDARGITNPNDFQLITPGLVYDSLASFPLIYIRGVGTDIFIPSADPSIATYIDGVYFPFGYGLARDLDVVERVEVLKGPQGTTFGRNTAGGAFNIITKDPSRTEAIGQIQTSYSRFKSTRNRAFLSGPLTETLSFGLGLTYNHSDEYYKTTERSAEPELQPNEDTGVRLKLRWAPFDDFDLTGTYYSLESTAVSSNLWDSQELSPLGMTAGATNDGQDNRTFEGIEPFSFLQAHVATAQARYFASPFDIKFIASDQRMLNDGQVDFDGTSADLASFNPTDMGATIKTYELQFTSKDSGVLSTIFDHKFDWVAGLYYIDSNAGFYRLRLDVAQLSDIFNNNFVPQAVRDVVNALPLPAQGPGYQVLLTGEIDVRSPAVYLHTHYEITDWLGLTLGARYQKEKRVMQDSSSAFISTTDQSTIPLLTFADRGINDSNLSPKIGLNLKPVDDVLLFASWSRGYKSATYNFINIYTEPGLVKEEQIDSYEVGAKSEWFGGRFRANAAVFQNTIDNLQIQIIALASGGAVNLDNAGEAEIKGADFEFTFAVTDDLIANLNGTYLKGKYKSYENGTGFDPATGMYTENLDFTGNTTIRSPKFSGTFSLFQTFDAAGGTVELGGDAYYNDGYFQDAQNSLEQESYYQAGLRTSYLYEVLRLRVTVFGTNLNGGKRYLFKFRNDFGSVGKLGPPAEYGVRINWDF